MRLRCLDHRPRRPRPAHSCTLEVVGRHLAYHITLDGGFVFVRAQPADAGGSLELLMTVADGPGGWPVVRELITALERSELRSLQPRPLAFGGTGEQGWNIE